MRWRMSHHMSLNLLFNFLHKSIIFSFVSYTAIKQSYIVIWGVGFVYMYACMRAVRNKGVPALEGKDFQWPSPWDWMYWVRSLSSLRDHAPLCKPTLEQHGALPIFFLSPQCKTTQRTHRWTESLLCCVYMRERESLIGMWKHKRHENIVDLFKAVEFNCTENERS